MGEKEAAAPKGAAAFAVWERFNFMFRKLRFSKSVFFFGKFTAKHHPRQELRLLFHGASGSAPLLFLFHFSAVFELIHVLIRLFLDLKEIIPGRKRGRSDGNIGKKRLRLSEVV